MDGIPPPIKKKEKKKRSCEKINVAKPGTQHLCANKLDVPELELPMPPSLGPFLSLQDHKLLSREALRH